MFINEDFVPKRKPSIKLPPGQYQERGFPVLSLGPTPTVDIKTWQLEVTGDVQNTITWNWEDFNKLPKADFKKDIHCVTKWSKFDTNWEGILMDTIIDIVKPSAQAKFLIAHSYDGYTTNVPLEDIIGQKAMVATSYDSGPITAEHGGPARLLVPHLYFWKSAKWLKKLEFVDHDKPGFWETRGYHNYGDPWKEQRYWND